jgi:hypothetical protein
MKPIDLIKKSDLTKDEAISLAESGWWKYMDLAEAADLQLRQDKLCMDFSTFHQGMELLLGRSVWTHEFADSKSLIAELEGKRKAPNNPIESLEKILNKNKPGLIPDGVPLDEYL